MVRAERIGNQLPLAGSPVTLLFTDLVDGSVLLQRAGEDEVQVVGVTGVPQQLAGLGMQHLTGRPQQV